MCHMFWSKETIKKVVEKAFFLLVGRNCFLVRELWGKVVEVGLTSFPAQHPGVL